MNHIESDIQKECVKACDQFFALKYPNMMIELERKNKAGQIVKYFASPLVATPNERNTSIQAGRRMKALGRRSGYPDLKLEVARGGYCGLYIEMKHKTGLTRNQIAWRDYIVKNGGRHAVCRSVEEFMELLIEYMKGSARHESR